MSASRIISDAMTFHCTRLASRYSRLFFSFASHHRQSPRGGPSPRLRPLSLAKSALYSRSSSFWRFPRITGMTSAADRGLKPLMWFSMALTSGSSRR